MKYFITTLAVGEPYFSNSVKFQLELKEKTKDALFNITTTKDTISEFEKQIEKPLSEYLPAEMQITTLDQFNSQFEFPIFNHDHVFPFNVNLKVLALKACLVSQKEFDYVFYIDADWKVGEGFSEEKIYRTFELMKYQEVDYAYERNSYIGGYKQNLRDCFFIDKLRDYNALEHPLWDEAFVVNEQFLEFQNGWKFKTFVFKWEQFLWYSLANKIPNYAEGFEIGVSAYEARMKGSGYGIFEALTNCFYFRTRYDEDAVCIRF